MMAVFKERFSFSKVFVGPFVRADRAQRIRLNKIIWKCEMKISENHSTTPPLQSAHNTPISKHRKTYLTLEDRDNDIPTKNLHTFYAATHLICL